MKNKKWLVLTFLLILSPLSISESLDIYQFKNKEGREDFAYLTENIRCMVCQNQNISESNAEFAVTMKNKIYQLIIAGETKEQIIKYVQNRYGDFILFSPPVKTNTLALWCFPVLMPLLVFFLLILAIRKRNMI